MFGGTAAGYASNPTTAPNAPGVTLLPCVASMPAWQIGL
jgi:hypothetical protein